MRVNAKVDDSTTQVWLTRITRMGVWVINVLQNACFLSDYFHVTLLNNGSNHNYTMTIILINLFRK